MKEMSYVIMFFNSRWDNLPPVKAKKSCLQSHFDLGSGKQVGHGGDWSQMPSNWGYSRAILFIGLLLQSLSVRLRPNEFFYLLLPFMKSRTLYLFLLLMSFLMSSMAQSLRITGTVRDSESNEPLPGAAVIEKGTTFGAFTDAKGTFSLGVSGDSAFIVIKYLGYVAYETQVAGGRQFEVSLKPDTALLEEVVVTAFNLKRNNKDLGYAVQKLETREIAEVKSPNFIDNLAARVAGLTVNQGATGVGSTSKVTIRGEASFTNNNPLFVVDGIPITNSSLLNNTNEAAAGFQEVDFGNGAMELNQEDISSVTVLKGPNAAALYGNRAANGVIIITTKDGSRSRGLGISLSTTNFVESPFKLPDFQNRYGQGNSGNFEFKNGLGGGINDNISYSWGPPLDQGLLIPQFDSPVALPDGSVVRGGDVAVHGGAPIAATPFVSQPDNLKNFYETGFTTINHVGISSGFEKGSFRLGLGDLRSDSPIPGVNLNRNTVSTKLVFEPVSRLKVSASANYFRSQSDNRPSGGYGSENINYSLVAWGPRSLNIGSLKDYWQPGLEEIQQYSFNYTFFDNPYFILLENRNSFDRDRLFGNIALSYEILKDLSLNVWSGMDYASELRKFRRHFSSNRFSNGAYAEQQVLFREVNTSFLATYKKNISGLGLEFSVGGNRMDQQAEFRQTEALSLAQPGIFNFSNAAAPLTLSQFERSKRINSLYALLKLNFQNFLFLDVTGRNDWSSALATPSTSQNTLFIYPSVSASLLVSKLIQLPGVVSLARLRAGWAEVGNDTDPYLTSGVFVAGTPYNSQPTFTAQDLIPNGGLLPEKTSALELGGDIHLWNGRFQLDFTWYQAMVSNQIISLPVPISAGYTQQVINGGAVRSSGLEIVAGLTPIKKADFEWNAFLNFSRNIAIVKSLPEEAQRITLAYSRVYDNENQTVWFQVEEGGRIGDMYGTGYQKNENGDFVIDENGNFVVDNTLKLLGNYNPDFMLGFSNNFRYKNFDLSFLFDWRQGGELVSRTLSLAAVGGQLIETENRPEGGIVADGVVNRGTQSEPDWQENTTPISAESYYRQFYDRNHEENNVYDASFLKLRQFSIGYTLKFPGGGDSYNRGRSLRIALIGRNVFAWSKIPHFDPEQLAVQGNQFVSGVEDMSYPSTRSLGFRLGFNF